VKRFFAWTRSVYWKGEKSQKKAAKHQMNRKLQFQRLEDRHYLAVNIVAMVSPLPKCSTRN
jgi:hypothetical protein